jgi:hypothetical protein
LWVDLCDRLGLIESTLTWFFLNLNRVRSQIKMLGLN